MTPLPPLLFRLSSRFPLRPRSGLALLLAGACAACVAVGADMGRWVARGASATPAAAPMQALPPPLPALDGPASAHWQRFAINGLLEPLLSNDGPLVWVDANAMTPCAATSRVAVDGAPVPVGTALPEAPFSVRWQLDDCLPFGADSLGLSGVVEMRVVRRIGRLDADVQPRGLVIVVADGRRARTDEPFAATLSLLPVAAP